MKESCDWRLVSIPPIPVRIKRIQIRGNMDHADLDVLQWWDGWQWLDVPIVKELVEYDG